MQESKFDGVRVRYDSAKSYDELRAGLFADIGEQPVPINDIATSTGDWQSYQERVESHVGPSGFMLFGLVDHGAWISKAGIERKALRVILGNPLIAITMLRHDVTAGLFAPVELLLLEEGSGSSLTYVKPSSLMVVEANPELLSAAEKLDAKLAALAEKVTASS
ncbi:hypothetical protein A5621_03170 [Mycobacterium colombiense]|uniref:DUF302 domain-containing protein n=1 Tax=Mycobacterium colombiense TaxID=339268 RepID=UPI0007FE201A|nr:DUF302 domain-containing protein [Mycobacterium colombiense]OBJ26505.1 hypothetical protein A5621_03170 [Mycobacterium colombiense]